MNLEAFFVGQLQSVAHDVFGRQQRLVPQLGGDSADADRGRAADAGRVLPAGRGGAGLDGEVP
jgi:hypothetical protein